MTIAEQIYNAAKEAGPIVSLFRLTIDLGIDYSHAHSVIHQMNQIGLITLTKTRRRGQPLMICARPLGESKNTPSPTRNAQRAEG